MKEGSIMSIVSKNQKVVTHVKVEKPEAFYMYEMELADRAAKDLGAADFSMFHYIYKNSGGYEFGLSCVAYCNYYGCSASVYHRQVKKMIEKGYLVATGQYYEGDLSNPIYRTVKSVAELDGKEEKEVPAAAPTTNVIPIVARKEEADEIIEVLIASYNAGEVDETEVKGYITYEGKTDKEIDSLVHMIMTDARVKYLLKPKTTKAKTKAFSF